MLFRQNTKIILSSLSVFSPSFSKCRRRLVEARPHHGLSFRISGKVSVDANGKSVISTPGTITYVPAGLSYETEIFEGGSMCVIHFMTENTPENLSHGVFTPQNPLIYRNLFSDILSRYRHGREYDFECFSIFYSILAEIRHEEYSAASFMPQRIRAAKSFIDRNYGENALSVSFLAEKAGISEVYFRKEFAKYCGMTPNAYINKIRIENAKALLKTGYYTVTETAMRCGFDSVSYFSDRFKTTLGISPKDYKSR